MGFHVTDRMGVMFSNPSVTQIDEVLAELDEPADPEHPDVGLTHETGWSLGAYPSGKLVWENLEADAPRHMTGVSRSTVRELWLSLAEGDLEAVEAHPWRTGY